MTKAIIYTKDYCPYCHKAKAHLEELGIEYDEIDVTTDKELQEEMMRRSGRTTVPQIFLHIGGCDDLFEHGEKGHLQPFME